MALTAPSTTAKRNTSQSGSGAKRLTARQKARARLADPLLPRKLHREDNVVTDGFLNTKRDKRLIKHSAFVSRITKVSKVSRSSSSSETKRQRRRRPSKKLIATLESLGEALDDIREAMDAEQAEKGEGQEGKIRHKSLKSRPGALKRKEKIVKGEMERFGRSLAQLSGIPAGGGTSAPASVDAGAANAGDTEMAAAQESAPATQPAQQPTSTAPNRWAALRGFISATMEQNPAFLAKR